MAIVEPIILWAFYQHHYLIMFLMWFQKTPFGVEYEKYNDLNSITGVCNLNV